MCNREIKKYIERKAHDDDDDKNKRKIDPIFLSHSKAHTHSHTCTY